MSASFARTQHTARVEGLGLLLVTVIAWGLNWPALKLLIMHLPPFSMRAVTAGSAGIVVMAFARLRGERLVLPRGQWRQLLVSTLLNYTSWLFFISLALIWLSASTAAIVAYTMPIWAIGFAWPVLGERPRLPHLVGLGLGVAGVAVVLGGGAAALPHGELRGVGAALAAAVLFALGSVMTKRAPIGLPPLASVGWQLLIGTAPIALLALIFEHPDFAALAPIDWIALIYSALVGLGFAYLCWFRALHLLPASLATTFTLLVPVIGVLSSGLLLGEKIGLAQLLALALTLGGVALAVRR
ncbi:MAG TPA: DMT family transporter [Acetobacteraceae bacterium]|jgi:probable blue pigment (indigoidine) exporter|nr:DMT family transporter [Acetobacteraceae bacterium]